MDRRAINPRSNTIRREREGRRGNFLLLSILLLIQNVKINENASRLDAIIKESV